MFRSVLLGVAQTIFVTSDLPWRYDPAELLATSSQPTQQKGERCLYVLRPSGAVEPCEVPLGYGKTASMAEGESK